MTGEREKRPLAITFFFFFYLAIDGMGRELKVESVIGEGQYMAVRLRLSRGKY